MRSRWLCTWFWCSDLSTRWDHQLPDLRFRDWFAGYDHDRISAGDGRARCLARPARSAADLPLILRETFPKDEGRRSRCVPIVSIDDTTRTPPSFCFVADAACVGISLGPEWRRTLKASAMTEFTSCASCWSQQRTSCDHQLAAARIPKTHPVRSNAGRRAVRCRCSRLPLLDSLRDE